MINSKYLAFITAVESGSFTKAADKLGYTQSGISHLVAALEEELNLPLLIRNKAGIQLTAEGERLLPFFRQLVETENAISFTSAELRGLSAGSLRIGTFSSAAVHLLPGMLRKFKSIYPGIDLQIRCGTYSAVENWLSESAVDGAFVTAPSLPQFELHPLAHDRMMAIIHTDDPLSAKDSVSISDLAEHPFILPAEGTNYHIGKLFQKAGIRPNIRFTMDDDFAAVAMVSCGFGVTILPELILEHYPMDHIKAVPLENAFRDIVFAVHRSRPLPPAVKAFLNIIR